MTTRRFAFLSLVICVIGRSEAGTRPVRWTFYPEQSLSWNRASHFCREQGGHLPVANNNLTYEGFKHWMDTFSSQHNLSKDIWIGLYSVNDTVPDLWERDNSSQTTSEGFWDFAINEPDHPAIEHCVRIAVDSKLWRTKTCSYAYGVVCEFHQDCCAFHFPPDVTEAVSEVPYPNVTSLESCLRLCGKTQRLERKCVTALWNQRAAVCEVESKKVAIQFSDDQQYSLYFQHCFMGDINSTNTTSENSFPGSDWGDAIPAKALSPEPQQNFICTLRYTSPTPSVSRQSDLPEITVSTSNPPSAVFESTALFRESSVISSTVTLPSATSAAHHKLSEIQQGGSTLDAQMSESTTSAAETSSIDVIRDETTSIGEQLCQCKSMLCARNVTILPPLPHDLTPRNTTSKHRRKHTSAWSQPSVSEAIISSIIIATSVVFIFFFLCFDIGRITMQCCKTEKV